MYTGTDSVNGICAPSTKVASFTSTARVCSKMENEFLVTKFGCASKDECFVNFFNTGALRYSGATAGAAASVVALAAAGTAAFILA
jgi:hypothetical protein